MALVPVYLGDAGGATGGTTGSFTPTANALLFASMGCRSSLGTSTVPAVVDTAGLTWTQIAVTLFDIGSGTRHRSRLMYALAPGSPAPMTATFSSTNTVRCGGMVFEVVGANAAFLSNFGDTNADNFAGSPSNTGDPAPVLASSPNFYASVLGFAWFNGNSAVSPPSGYTEVTEVTYGSDTRGELAYRSGVTNQTVAWTTGNTGGGAIALELRPLVLPRGQGWVLGSC